MKTLPTNIQNGKDGGSEPIYLVRLIPESGDSWSEFRWGTKAVTITDIGAFSGGRLAKDGLPTLEESIDILNGANVGHVGNFTVKLLNQDKYHETLDLITNHFENREIKVYIVFTNGSLSSSDWLCLKSGIVKEIKYSIEGIIFSCVDAGEKRHKDIPGDKINKTDYPNCPDDNVGKIMPLLYGELYGGSRYLNTRNEIPIIVVDEAKYKYLISLNQCKDLATVLFSKSVIYDEGTKCFISIRFGSETTPPETISYGRPTTIEFPKDKTIFGHVSKQFEVQGEKTDPSTLDLKNTIDDDIDSYKFLTENQKLYVKIKLPDLFDIVVDTYIVFNVKFGTISTNGGKLRYYNRNWDNGVGKFSDGITFDSGDSGYTKNYYIQRPSGEGGPDNSAHGKDELQADQNDIWKIDELNTYEFGIEINAGESAEIKNIWMVIYYPILRRDAIAKYGWVSIPERPEWARWGIWGYTKPIKHEMDNVTVSPKGAKFGAWIDADGRDNGYNQNDLVEKGAYDIEEILRTELGLSSSEINYQSFDACGNTTDGWKKNLKLAGKIDDEKNSLDIVKEICQNLAIAYFTDYQNKEKVINFMGTTIDRTIDLVKLTSPKAGKSSIKLQKSSIKNIYTDFYVRYKKNFATGNFEGLEYCTPDENSIGSSYQTKCSNAESNYKTRQTYTFEANWIRDQSTAQELCKRLVDWFTIQHYIIGLVTSLNALDCELGDKVKIDHSFLPTGIRNLKAFIVDQIRINCNKDEISLKFTQVEV